MWILISNKLYPEETPIGAILFIRETARTITLRIILSILI